MKGPWRACIELFAVNPNLIFLSKLGMLRRIIGSMICVATDLIDRQSHKIGATHSNTLLNVTKSPNRDPRLQLPRIYIFLGQIMKLRHGSY